MYYMGFTYVEAYNIPIWQRVWFMERLNKEIKRSGDASGGQQQSRGAAQNTPDARAMQGRQRAQVPSKLRRFT